MNPLNDFPAARRIAYYVQFVVAGLVLLVGVGFAAADVALPTWYVVTAAVTSGLWSYLGLTAAQNTPAGRLRGDRGALTVAEACILVLTVVVLLLVLGFLR